MGSWHKTLNHYLPNSFSSKAAVPPVVYSRDFAYADNGPIVVLEGERMAAPTVRADIHTASAKSFAELLAGPTVDVFVGAERKHWSLHRNLLRHHSSYFDTELPSEHEMSKTPNEHASDKVELPDDDPRGFELLVKWLYQGHLQDCAMLADNDKYEYAVACHKLYLLCDKFGMVRLQNLAMDQYRRCLYESRLVPDAEEINEIYRASSDKSPFRSLMVKIAARQIMDPEIDRDAEAYRKCFEHNPDFAVEMVNAIRYMSGGILFDDPTEGDDCEFHEHGEGSDCNAQVQAHVKRTGKVQVNGVGPTTPARTQQRQPPPPVVESISERRTPRKLRTPHKTPLAAKRNVSQSAELANGTSVPSLVSNGHKTPSISTATPAKPNARVRDPPRTLPHRLAPPSESGAKEATAQSAPAKGRKSALQIKPPAANGVTRNPDVQTPTRATPGPARRAQAVANGVTEEHRDTLPKSPAPKTTVMLRDDIRRGTSNAHRSRPSSSGTAGHHSALDTDPGEGTVKSRKRKFDDRTPRKASRAAGEAPPTDHPSSNRPYPRPVSRASSSRKTTNGVNGMIQQFNGRSTNWDVRSQVTSEGHGRRPPPKLRQPTLITGAR